jgi:hypothetical protein
MGSVAILCSMLAEQAAAAAMPREAFKRGAAVAAGAQGARSAQRAPLGKQPN